MALVVKRPETRVLFCLDGDLKAEHEAAEAELNAARSRSLADARLNDPAKDIARKVNDLEEQMKASTVSFLVRGMKRGDWNELVAAHAPREGNALDKSYGFNVEALMTAAIPKSIAGVENQAGEALPFVVAEEWDALADDMTDSQYEDFILATLRVNKGRNEVPFSLSAFRMIQASDQT
jgi:protein required for attachment to host cells